MPKSPHALLFACLPLAMLVAACVATRSPRDVGWMESDIETAEEDLARGDYPAADAAARQVLAADNAPRSFQGRASLVLGKVLYFDNRVHMAGTEDTEESKVKRKRGLRLAEKTLRRAIALGPPSATEAHLYLAYAILQQGGPPDEARQELAKYLSAVGPGERDVRAEHFRQCDEFWKDHAGVPIHNADNATIRRQVVLPERLSQDEPQYTEAAWEARLEGDVVVQVVIDRDGEVVCAVPVVGMPLGLTEATLDALNEWRFKPARLDGEPIPVFYSLTTNFRPE